MQNFPRTPEWYAADFIKQLQLDQRIEQKCERTCLLWSKEHWASEAGRVQMNLQQTKERSMNPADSMVESLFLNAQFLNTVAQVYGRLFGFAQESCAVKDFPQCPYSGKRHDLLQAGSLASVFVTILHKAVMYAALENHPLDSGLVEEEYRDVYGVDLTNFQDLKDSLADGRFAGLYEAVIKRAKQVAGIGGYSSYWDTN